MKRFLLLLPLLFFALLLALPAGAEETEPDPVYAGKICDRCMECVKNCHGKCISPIETVKKNICGVDVEWAKRDELACSKAFREGGLNRELSPFDGNYPRKYGYGLAHEGSCGCIRACMVRNSAA